MSEPTTASGFPRLTYLRIKNYRALRDVELRDLTPLTVFIGPNGSGKSTILDALAFLAEAVSGNLQQAWEKRNRFAGMRTRGQEGPIEFEVEVVISKKKIITYLLELSEKNYVIEITNEQLWLESYGKNKMLLFEAGIAPETVGILTGFFYYKNSKKDFDRFKDHNFKRLSKEDWPKNVKIIKGMPQRNPFLYYEHMTTNEEYSRIIKEVQSIQYIISSYRLIHLTDDHLKGYSDAGPREKLSGNGDNLPNVLYYLHERHPEALARITAQLRRWVPQLAEVVTEITSDERLLLRFKDAAFEKPLPAQYMSEGTMRLAALLTLLYEPNATGLLGLEEPENELHLRLLPRLAEELIKATETRQLLVATHSPALLNSMEPEQVWILHRGADGYAQVARVADMPDIVAMVAEGSPLGYLWSRNFFEVGDPLASSPSQPVQE